MKPTRGLPNSWFGSMPRQRRISLVSIALLLVFLGAIVLYQRLQMPGEPPRQMPTPVEEPPMKAMPPSTPTEPGRPVAEAGPDTGTAEEAVEAPPKAAPPERLSTPLAGWPSIIKTYNSLDEAYGDFRMYTAIAYAADPGQSVLAPARGKVAAISEDPAEGRILILDHGGGLTTHLTGLGKVLVVEGTQVERGAIIAQVGQPGPARSGMGTHLAFEVRLDDSPVDPTTYLE